MKQLQLPVREGVEPVTFGLQIRRSNHSVVKYYVENLTVTVVITSKCSIRYHGISDASCVRKL